MFSHVTLGTNDWARARPFWQAIAATLELPVLLEHEEGMAWGEPTGPKIFIGPAVDAFHAAALANGGSDEGAPGPRPHYHPNCYGAYARDPDGNKLQAVCHASRG